MQISTFQLQNYKSYRDSGELCLSSGFNVLVGQNNAGKSTLLEGLGLNFPAKPHKSLSTLPRFTSTVNPTSMAKVALTVSSEELRDILLSFPNGPFFVPVPDEFRGQGAQKGELVLRATLSSQQIDFWANVTSNSNQNALLQNSRLPSHGQYQTRIDSGSASYYVVTPTTDRTNFSYSIEGSYGPDHDFGLIVCQRLRDRIYSFRAERFNVGTSPGGIATTLAPNASNLPEVLSNLQGTNPARFVKFNEYVRQILPTIFQVSVRTIPNNQEEVIVWTEDPATQRDDLAVPLAESGTGVGQVLAILYVVLTSQFSRTILIDEPNSFLHPAAARKLIEILRIDFPMHQYIVATHSPDIIRAADPTTLFMVRIDGRESKLERLDSNDVKDQGKCLLEVGARLSDVFGADEIVWVEGDTEEACFRLIVRDILKKPLLGRTIAAVRNVGDFEGKRPSAKIIWEIYSQLTKSNALIPPAIAFVFDREQRSEAERDDLTQRSRGRLKFLPRRMYENYLLAPEALTAVLLTLPSFQGSPLSIEQVKEWLESNGGGNAYLSRPSDRIVITDQAWVENVNGAKLLHDLFATLSDNKEEYRKTVHSVQLTEWLIQNNPNALDDIKYLLAPMFSA